MKCSRWLIYSNFSCAVCKKEIECFCREPSYKVYGDDIEDLPDMFKLVCVTCIEMAKQALADLADNEPGRA